MSKRAWQPAASGAVGQETTGSRARRTVGRHAAEDDPTLTPIFHALTRGGWPNLQESPADAAAAAEPGERASGSVETGTEARSVETETAAEPTETANAGSDPTETDPLETFRRDPLGAPLPTQVLAAVPPSHRRSTGRRRAETHAAAEEHRSGRHHRRLVPLEGGVPTD